MKLFISWSGKKSKEIAEYLRIWLKDVIHFLDPWMSSEDISIGLKWNLEIAKELEICKYGILCLTKENINSPWILFEAGALSKFIDKSFVCPFLIDLKNSEVTGPLVQFQSAMADKIGTKKLLISINKRLGKNCLSKDQLDKSFEKWWPELEKELQKLSSIKDEHDFIERTDRDILEEILDLFRIQLYNNKTDDLLYSNTQKNSLLESLGRRNFKSSIDKIDLNEDESDINVFSWAKKVESLENNSLNGCWLSRWRGGHFTKWMYGNAVIMQVKEKVVILTSDETGIYLTIAFLANNSLKGNYLNMELNLDATPWNGKIINNNKINGQWLNGRWDFIRS